LATASHILERGEQAVLGRYILEYFRKTGERELLSVTVEVESYENFTTIGMYDIFHAK
jgi:hypothetical protein